MTTQAAVDYRHIYHACSHGLFAQRVTDYLNNGFDIYTCNIIPDVLEITCKPGKNVDNV